MLVLKAKKIRFSCLFLLSIFTVTSCNYERRKNTDSPYVPESNPEPATTATPEASTTPVPVPKIESTYSAINKSIFTTKCLTCHNSNKASADVSFSNYQELNDSIGLKYTPVKPNDPERSGIVLTVESGKMPPGVEKLSTGEKNAIREWVQKGALND